MTTTLTISHNLYLTREQRYSWYNGTDLEVIGVSVPVWFQKGVTSEPAVELFVPYRLLNRPETILRQEGDGYAISVPPKSGKAQPLPDEVWNVLTEQEKEAQLEALDPNPGIDMLLDTKDYGAEFLAFRQFSKGYHEDKELLLVHFIEIKPIEELLTSLC